MPGVERDKSHQSNQRPPKFRDEMQDTRGIWLTYNCVLFFESYGFRWHQPCHKPCCLLAHFPLQFPQVNWKCEAESHCQ